MELVNIGDLINM
jgi:hypothetical protein